MSKQVVSVRSHPELETTCSVLADHVQGVLIGAEDAVTTRYLLEYDHSRRLQLVDCNLERHARLHIDLAPKRLGQGADPLMRAIGHQTESVIDCTGGWCTDAAHIANHGISIIGIEQHSVVHAMVSDALKRCPHPAITEHLSLIYGDSIDWLEQYDGKPEVIYLDPMYPPKAGTALPKKPLQFLQQLTHSDSNQEEALLTTARRKAARRVVVKRPHYAEPVLPGRSGEISAKLVRFDLYSPTQ
jgi:16S rRNA (guanine1516-N2)-methyltransferase